MVMGSAWMSFQGKSEMKRKENIYLTRLASKDSRYSLAESCPRSLLYPLVKRPSACRGGLC